MKSWTLALVLIAAIAAAGAWLRFGQNPRVGRNAAPLQFIPDTKLQLVGKYGSLEIYVDFSVTNKIPSYAIFEGNECVVLRENTASNTLETSYFENGFNVLLTKRDKNGKISERRVCYEDGSMGSKYTYIDKDGDGFWDVLLDHNRKISYVRTNLCWVSRSHDTNPLQTIPIPGVK